MKKILFVFGTRPEAIKMAPLVNKLKKESDFETIVAVTAQHREMLDQVLDLFDIVPNYDLNIMKQGQDLYDVTISVLRGIRDILVRVRPDLVLVHGDTATTFAASLAAFYEQIEVGHVEAGLRTHDLRSPWPEEANRQLTTRLSKLHFAPTQRNMRDLLNEGIADDAVFVTGNTVIDALQSVVEKITKSEILKKSVRDKLYNSGLNIEVEHERYVLVTGHRRENFGLGIKSLCQALCELATEQKETHFIYPVHLNPNVREPVHQYLSGLNNIHLISPLDYEPFVWLMKHAHLILTDSGGVQEEAPGLGKPVLVMRDNTERPEAIDAGTVKLIGTSRENIKMYVSQLLSDATVYDAMSKSVNPYGDGYACDRIIDSLKKYYEI